MSITRLAVINDERKLLLGIDKDEIFMPGHVYEVKKLLGEIIIKDIGKYALPYENKHRGATENSDASQQVYSGLHLLTEEEYQKLNL